MFCFVSFTAHIVGEEKSFGVDDNGHSADCGDYVVAVGCHDLYTTGKKRFQKKYYRHSTRPGSLKEITMDRMFAKWGGAEVLRKAVSGMLPKNRLRDKRLARLKGNCGFFWLSLSGWVIDEADVGIDQLLKDWHIHIKRISSSCPSPRR